MARMRFMFRVTVRVKVRVSVGVRVRVRVRAPPGGCSVHPALTTSGVAVFLKPPSRCWYYAYALTLPLQALLQ